MNKIVLLLLLTITFSGCEKDDICTDETTPRLVLEFYDISNPANLKNVLNVKVTGEGQTALGIFSGVSKIELPIDITQDTTKFSLILNSTSLSSANEDMLQFNYARQNVFVSRACGYKTIFEFNATPNGVIKTDATNPDGIWIQDINILTTNIETENETHINIYF